MKAGPWLGYSIGGLIASGLAYVVLLAGQREAGKILLIVVVAGFGPLVWAVDRMSRSAPGRRMSQTYWLRAHAECSGPGKTPAT